MPVLKTIPALPEPIHAPNLARLPWLLHGFSTRVGGFSTAYSKSVDSQLGSRVPRPSSAWAAVSPQAHPQLNLGFTPEDRPATVRRNRAAFLSSLSAIRRDRTPWPLLTLRQFHSDVIYTVTRAVAKKFADAPLASRLVGDGLITDVPGLALAVLTADCLPIVLVDPKHHAVGVFHAGWRGTLKRIAAKGAGRMKLQFGSRFSDLRAAIGPGIGACCYNVGEEVREAFQSQFPYADDLFHEVEDDEGLHRKYPMLFLNQRAPGHGPQVTKIMLNLAEANRRQLMELGLQEKNIAVLPLCTICHPEHFFSHRAQFGKTGRMMAVAAIRKFPNRFK